MLVYVDCFVRLSFHPRWAFYFLSLLIFHKFCSDLKLGETIRNAQKFSIIQCIFLTLVLHQLRCAIRCHLHLCEVGLVRKVDYFIGVLYMEFNHISHKP